MAPVVPVMLTTSHRRGGARAALGVVRVGRRRYFGRAGRGTFVSSCCAVGVASAVAADVLAVESLDAATGAHHARGHAPHCGAPAPTCASAGSRPMVPPRCSLRSSTRARSSFARAAAACGSAERGWLRLQRPRRSRSSLRCHRSLLPAQPGPLKPHELTALRRLDGDEGAVALAAHRRRP